MPRTFPAAFEAERAKTGGAFPRRILEIDHGGTIGIKYYASAPIAALDPGPTAEGRVVDWGTMTVGADPGRVGGYGTRSITLADADGVLRTRFDGVRPGIQRRGAKVWLWFDGTTWPNDAVVEFDGAIGDAASWDAKSAAWQLNLAGIEKATEDKTIGIVLTRDNFPEVACAGTEGKTLPLVYGDYTRRVPGVLIDRPGYGRLAAQLNVPGTVLTLHDTAGHLGFTVGSQISVLLGLAGASEVITGTFANASDTTMAVASHGSVYAAGTIQSLASVPGYTNLSYIELDYGALPNGSSEDSFGGYPLLIKHPVDGTWDIYVVQSWHDTGTGFATVPIDSDVNGWVGQPWKLVGWPGAVPVWPVGTEVSEMAPWVFAANQLPSKQVVRVEARADARAAGAGQDRSLWYQYHSSYYSVVLDNTAFNAALGRDAGDPGITTVATNNPPWYYGFRDDTIFISIKGTTDDNTTAGAPITNPVEVIKNLLENPFIGNVANDPQGVDKIDDASFTAAAALVTEQCGFAIMEERPLHDTCAELALQCGCLFGWDQGKAVIAKLPSGAGTPIFTADESVIAQAGDNGPPDLSYEILPAKDIVTELYAKFRLAVAGPDVRIARRSDDAVTELGKTTREYHAWAYQYPSSIAPNCAFRLLWGLNRQRRVRFRAFLTAYHLRFGDVVTVQLNNGTADYFGPVTIVVTSVKSTAADAQSGRMESVEIEGLAITWDYTAAAIPTGPDACLSDSPPEFETDLLNPTGNVGEVRGGIGITVTPAMYLPAFNTSDNNGGFPPAPSGGGGGSSGIKRAIVTSATPLQRDGTGTIQYASTSWVASGSNVSVRNDLPYPLRQNDEVFVAEIDGIETIVICRVGPIFNVTVSSPVGKGGFVSLPLKRNGQPMGMNVVVFAQFNDIDASASVPKEMDIALTAHTWVFLAGEC